MSLEARYAFRQQLVEALEQDLVGPRAPEEVIFDAPITRYAIGVLFPQEQATLAPEEDMDVVDEGDDVVFADPPVALANAKYPSSMGLTFSVDTVDAPRVVAEVSVARYEPLEEIPSDLEVPEHLRGDVYSRKWGDEPPAWKRVPIEIEPIEIDAAASHQGGSEIIAPGLELYVKIRPPDDRGIAAITLVLVNTNVQGRGRRDVLSYFQPRIRLLPAQAGVRAFVDRGSVPSSLSDRELASFALLYRDNPFLAIGHGCSVLWETPSEDGRAEELETTYVPQYELSLAHSNPLIAGQFLSLRWLSTADHSAVIGSLNSFCDGYGSWVEARKGEVGDLPPGFQEVGTEHLERCEEALGRMRAGVQALASGDSTPEWAAFRLANEAMLEQRARSSWIKSGKAESRPLYDDSHTWYPFQLAFFLQCLRGIADSKHEDRSLADLLWFPTGGGKTEAYLGLIAFTVFLRRLRERSGGGVTALMRYTLRLLTIQQFDRAALLIACCECIRRNRSTSDLGSDPISIGLWVGKAGSPLTRKAAKQSLKKLAAGHDLQEENPVQLHSCPWCDTSLDHNNYYLNRGEDKLVIDCRQQGCEFKGGLPAFVVDEDIYDYRPTLIIATADKFASLPWREQTAELFNLNSPDTPPPELIIQDELHLISGPLGTLAGLYETAIDRLCLHHGVGPKVVASTATIRRAGPQSRSLFAREVRQFPPPGLSAKDSYFAVEADRQERGTRMYVGLLSPSTSHTTLMVRTYAALLQNTWSQPTDQAFKDPYWTLIGYFNSLRVLGGARMQVQDDVNERIELLAKSAGTARRAIDNRIELTSREPSSSIPQHLEAMELALPDPYTLDVILATNMISVGMDVDRLGLMVMMGQPPSTSEYIQSTSRVGRKYPGLVVTLYNDRRSRDRSHYESFLAYHSALYRQVDSTSVTPFSPRARDRALHSVFVSLARLTRPELRANEAAGAVVGLDLSEVHAVITSRADSIGLPEDTIERVQRELIEVEEEWKRRAEENPDLVYYDFKNPGRALLLTAGSVYEGDEDVEGFPTMWSLRDVDRSSNLYVTICKS